MLPTCLPQNAAAIDTESNGLNVWRGARMFSTAATFMDGRTLYWRGEFSGLRQLLEDPSIDKVFLNAKHDIRILKYSGFKVRGRVWEVGVFYHLLDGRQAGKGLGLERLAKRYLPPTQRKVVDELNQWFDEHNIGKEQRWERFADLPHDILKRRNCGDTEITMSLFKRAYTTVARTFPFLLEQEHELIPVVSQMEERGVEVDYDEIDKQIDYFQDIVEDVVQFCEGVVGREGWNINSRNDQIELLQQARLWEPLMAIAREDPSARTDGTVDKPASQAMPKLNDWNLRNLHHPVAHMLLLGKAANKMAGTFLEQMRREATNGILHAGFNPLGTTTGRFSCSKPNLTNIPIEGDRRTAYTAEEAEESFEMTGINYAPHIKRIFKVRRGKAHTHSDKKQAEMAMIAHYTGDPTLIEIFNSGQNFHEGVCRHLYGELTKGLKTRTKAVVFGFCYGAGNRTLMRKIGATSILEAIKTRKRLETSLPSLPRWQKQLRAQIAEKHYVETIHGRRHYIKLKESYIAVNRMCQGSVGDEVKSRMIALNKMYEAEGFDAQVLLMIHDDIANEHDAEDAPRVVPHINRVMHEASKPYKLQLPSSLDITYTRWSDLVEVNDVNKVPSREVHAQLLHKH